MAEDFRRLAEKIARARQRDIDAITQSMLSTEDTATDNEDDYSEE